MANSPPTDGILAELRRLWRARREEVNSRYATVARRDVTDATVTLPVERVASVATERGMLSLFNLYGGQRVPRNAWVHLASWRSAR